MSVSSIWYTIFRMQGLNRVQAANVSEMVYAEIEGAISRCDLPPGSLLSDRQLSEALGVSRTPVREALQSLEASGLVVRRGRSGWGVSEFDERDIRELVELRRLMEPPGLERLAENWEEGIVTELSTFFDDFEHPLSEEERLRYHERDHRFHRRIVELSGNSRLISFYGNVEKHINRIRHSLSPGYPGRMDEIIRDHREICSAIARRELHTARHALLIHLEGGEKANIMAFRQRRGESVDGAEEVKRSLATDE